MQEHSQSGLKLTCLEIKVLCLSKNQQTKLTIFKI
uniref:Uncharacterized protein n=1 Tax=Rhizophora mucronata TaxID=61149 RepID=A0A2P2PLT0_RHIMU